MPERRLRQAGQELAQQRLEGQRLASRARRRRQRAGRVDDVWRRGRGGGRRLLAHRVPHELAIGCLRVEQRRGRRRPFAAAALRARGDSGEGRGQPPTAVNNLERARAAEKRRQLRQRLWRDGEAAGRHGRAAAAAADGERQKVRGVPGSVHREQSHGLRLGESLGQVEERLGRGGSDWPLRRRERSVDGGGGDRRRAEQARVLVEPPVAWRADAREQRRGGAVGEADQRLGGGEAHGEERGPRDGGAEVAVELGDVL
mmetsp:Transcript_45639/g.146918  ORF Transcript_45639/g.146918 Transcript_45639/m.146918 type:complete len:258 (-) Transcript_45639:715-1488(-)